MVSSRCENHLARPGGGFPLGLYGVFKVSVLVVTWARNVYLFDSEVEGENAR